MNKIYDLAAEIVRNPRHLSLNQLVPEEVGCAEAVSWILLNTGYPVPHKGIESVNGLIEWMLQNGFEEIHQAVPGAIITAHSPNYYNPSYAHVGVCLHYGIGSNDSATGLFKENYSYDRWKAYFGNHGSVIRYFYHE